MPNIKTPAIKNSRIKTKIHAEQRKKNEMIDNKKIAKNNNKHSTHKNGNVNSSCFLFIYI